MATHTPFIILCTGRTGSTHLAGMLEQHCSVRQYGEVFHLEHQKRAPARGRVALDHDDGAAFAEWIFALESPDALAIGFKMLYRHARMGALSSAWDYLAGLADLRVLHLTRTNLLEMLVSHRLAASRGFWHLPARRARPCLGQIELGMSECIDYFEHVEAGRLWALERLKSRWILSVDYDELSIRRRAILKDICDALGVSHFSPQPLLSKLECWPMSARVSNYQELRDMLAGAKYEAYFCD